MATRDAEQPVSPKAGSRPWGNDRPLSPSPPPPPPPPGYRPSFRRQSTMMIESRIRRMDKRINPYRRYSEDYSREPSPRRDDPADGPVAVVYNINADGVRELEVQSKSLVDAIKKVNKHPPLRPVTDRFTEEEPYPTLFRHMDDIRQEILSLNDERALLDLKALEEVSREMVSIWNDAREESLDGELTSYDLIWKHFHPGDLVVREDDIGNLWLFVLIEITRGDIMIGRRANAETKRICKFSTWLLTWDGVESRLNRRSVIFNCTEFSGRRPVKSLPVYPLKFLKGVSEDETKYLLVKRGQQWWKLITERTACLEYNGPAYTHELDDYRRRKVILDTRGASPKRLRVDGRVVIDGDSKGLAPVDVLLGATDDDYDDRYDERAPARPVNDYRDQYQWDKLPITTELTDEQAMLCPPIIGCYGLRSKEFYSASVTNLRTVGWNVDAMDHLVLDVKKKDMLKGLVGYHYSRDDRGKGDLIAGKGQSLVILLHGPPGVGKTLTAESIAEAVQKPLVSLSIGDMVWDESRLQERLESEFKRATYWDAILLLDEADVVLEARSFEDVRRNGIVSIFLRQLEYYQGVLFLTTNRVSTMDTAFQSRIQIGIGFQSMTPEIRAQVWAQLLALNGRDKIIGMKALQDVKQKLSKCELNGRQIRNVLNVAEGLAFNQYGEAGKLKYSHILEAVEAAIEFQKLLDDSKSSMRLEQTVWAPYRGGDNDSVYTSL
ncbi:p-loop containing nucleoside triphosphate hydrolase protein [Pleurostoma richardsiae]|uniref:P-loop containing nucleoside triphosphate hydrolase protein n=1 Tax=Pleurostoma richardsiae TaxID=41990 RepID=A0AA38RQ74_9PEZI|nr:p-loop containing nucleoside triphosphate hydrolase protein [Pleurostoma richardsiae]